MITTDNYFEAYRFFEQEHPTETLCWDGCNSTGLAEIIEMAISKGYSYKLECHDKMPTDPRITVPIHIRQMIFTYKEN